MRDRHPPSRGKATSRTRTDKQARSPEVTTAELQARLAAIVESSDDAIISKDLNGTILSWNRGAQRLFGYNADEVIGQHISLLAAPDVMDEIPTILERVSRGERVDHYQTKRRAKDGRILSISLTISPIYDADGRIVGASKVARDITHDKHYSVVQARLAAIVESSDDAILSKDLNGTILSWNRGAQRLFGYTADEMVGQHISVLAAPDVVDEIPNILARIAQGERIDHYQTRRRTKDGRILTVALTISPIRDANGTIVGASKVARDITELQRHQAELAAANESLTRSIADLEHFAYSASHDLQEPLRMVAIYSQMLQKKFGGTLSTEGQEYLTYILEGATRMQQLLGALRSFTQASTLNQKPAMDIDANEVLEHSLADLTAAIQSSGASITHTTLPTVRMHGFQLEQLFQNLIGNAIRYRSQELPKIHIAAERSGDWWTFSVQDNGIGINPQYKEQIFGLFKRLHSSAEYPGSGMGLAICERIVQRIGGRIWAESELGHGSTFFFTVPAG